MNEKKAVFLRHNDYQVYEKMTNTTLLPTQLTSNQKAYEARKRKTRNKFVEQCCFGKDELEGVPEDCCIVRAVRFGSGDVPVMKLFLVTLERYAKGRDSFGYVVDESVDMEVEVEPSLKVF